MLREERRAVLTRWRFCLILCTLLLGCLLADQAPGATGKLTPAENYVRQQAAKGEWADLQKRFGDKEKERTLSARFLEDLLTGSYKVHRKGVMIKNAVITGSLDLERARIPHAVELIFCRFQRDVVCRDTVFEKNLTMNGSHFDQGADFNGSRVSLNAEFDKAVFQGLVDFIAANIGRQFSAQGGPV